jgi:cation transport regulator ChaB
VSIAGARPALPVEGAWSRPGTQSIHRKAFNAAGKQCGEAGKRRGSATHEETARRGGA